MFYRSCLPDRALRPWVDCFWVLNYQAGNNRINETILPNGKIEIIFELEGNYSVTNRKTNRVKTAWLSGMHCEPLTISYSGHSHLVGIRFQPNGLYPFLSFPVHETVNQVENLNMIWGSDGEEVCEKLSSCMTNHQLFEILHIFLLKRLIDFKLSHQSLIVHALEKMKRQPAIGVNDLAASLGYSGRHFQRIFKDQTGLAPKTMIQLLRFEQVYTSLHSNKELNPFTMDTFGYHDQSHFIKEFKRFSGMTPTEYLQQAGTNHNFF